MKIKKFVKEKFWIIYFVVICLVLIWQLFTCGTPIFESDILGTSADDEYEILDENVLETVFRVGRDDPKGFYIYNFQMNNLTFTNEKLIITFLNEDSGEVLQQQELNMENQVRNLYVMFEDEISAGTLLRIQIKSQGFKSTGPIIGLSDTSSLGSALWKNGELLNEYLCGALCYNTVTYDYVKPIIYFMAELIIGVVLLLAAKKMSLPFYIRVKKKSAERRKLKWKKSIAAMGAVLALSVVFLDYVYTYTVEEIIDQRSYEILCRENEIGNQQIVLNEEDEISQIFSVGEKNFSAIGINIQEHEGVNGILRCRLYDLASGNLVIEKAYEISSLRELSNYVAKDEIGDDKDIIKSYLAMDLQEVLEDSAGKFYKLLLKGENLSGGQITLSMAAGENFSIASNGKAVSGNLCMVALYSNNLFLKTLFKWMAVIIVLFLTLATGYLCVRTVATEKAFAISALVLGLVFCFLIPPYCVPDEWAHFDGVYRVSNEILGITEIPGPNRIYKRACDIEEEKYGTLSITQDEYKAVYEGIGKTADDETLIMGYADNSIGNVTVFNYLASAIGFTVARLLHFGHMGMIVLGRVFNLLAVIAMMYIAIKKIPFGKSAIAVTGLLPITLQQAASCSYDGVLIGFSYIFVAYCLHIVFDEDISVMDIAIMSIAGCMLSTCKGGVYTPILGLVILIPFAGGKINKKYLIGTFSIVVSMILVFLAQFSDTIVSLFSTAQGSALRMGASGGVELYTVSYFMEYPKEFIRILQNTFVLMGDFYVQGMLGGALGIMDTKLPWFLLMAFLVLLLMCVYKGTDGEKSFNAGQRIYTALLCLASTMLVLISMLLAWTAVGTVSIQGVQGRYFIPIIGLVFLVFRNNIVVRKKRGDILVFAAGLLDMFAVGFALLSIF